MAERPIEGHKRSKSSLAVSVLNREKPRTDEDDPRSSLSLESPTAFSGERGSGPSSKKSPVTPPYASKTIEQSIRAFKVFEILRSGDKEAIMKAVGDNESLEGTTILHLAVQCADPAVVEQVFSAREKLDINAQDKDGNTPLHLASMLGRTKLVQLLLAQKTADDTVLNYQGRSAMDLARTPEIFQLLQLDRAVFTDLQVRTVQNFVARRQYEELEKLLEDSRAMSVLDVNAMELATEKSTVETGGTLLHEAARKRDLTLIQLLLLNGADPFRRDRKGKLPQDVTKDDRTRAILKKSPAATAAQRGIQEKAILGGYSADKSVGGKESREIKGYLKKWTNYTSGYKLRWFVLEDGVLSYYKHQDDAGSACRGAMNMRIAQLSMDSQDKTRFEILGKSSIKYHLRANHAVEAKRWFWALNNAIQFAKDEAQEEERRLRETDAARQAMTEQRAKDLGSTDAVDQSGLSEDTRSGTKSALAGSTLGIGASNASRASFMASATAGSIAEDDNASACGSYEPSIANEARKTTNLPGELDDDDEYGEEARQEVRHVPKDALNITVQSINLQLEMLAEVSKALQAQVSYSPNTKISDPVIDQAITTYGSAVQSLRSMVGDLLKISRDRDAHWQYRLDREVDMRRLWEESMAQVAKEQEALEGRIGESEEKRKRTKRALREALEEPGITGHDQVIENDVPKKDRAADASDNDVALSGASLPRRNTLGIRDLRRKSTIAAFTDLSDSDSDDDEEFFDAVGAGEVPVGAMPTSPSTQPSAFLQEPSPAETDNRMVKTADISTSFSGYEDGIRKRLKLAADNRPTISLWGILKSMIGKDMTKMTLPVSFNEPTSLLQRVAEDLEYIDLLDTAAEAKDSTERMVYVAAFAASEYCSTIGRVAKPFNPLLGETYEYSRPDKGYRFFIEQVSHHPPIGAAWAESPKWDYYGESAVKSKFYGKSFDINPLGTWFLKLRPSSGGEELYTWKKVTSSVIGIITGSPTVDNYGPMEIRNWTTGDVCQLDFKPRGWKASSAYQVSGKVLGADGRTRWSMGGRWNDKIYARLTPGFEAAIEGAGSGTPLRAHEPGSSRAFLVWEANKRPAGIPFNLTPFVVTLNAAPERLHKVLPPTDTRLRPDQRAMEDGEYDFAASEKTRLEEKQRAKRREREANGEEFVPRWFTRGRCEVTDEEYWVTKGEYWKMREAVANGGKWERLEDIF